MPTASPNGTYKIGFGASVTDAQGIVYAINSNGQITVNGKVDPTTARVDAIGIFNGQVWQKNAYNLWFSKASAAAPWVDFPPSAGNPMPVPRAFFNDNGVLASSGAPYSQLYDTHGNLWQINAAGQVVIDGQVDTTTARVVEMALVNGRIWQENADGVWYSKMKPADTWTAGVRADPALAALMGAETWVGGHGNNSPLVAANWSKGVVPTPDRNISMTAGVMNLGSGDLGGETLTISGEVPVSTNTAFGGYEAVAPVINMTAGGSLRLAFAQAGTNAAKVNVTGGKAALDVAGPYPASPDLLVTADKLSSVLLSGSMVFGRLVEHGGTVLLNGAFTGSGTSVLLDASLAGLGTMTFGPAQSYVGSLEVTGSVGAGVSVAMRGDPGRGTVGTLTLDNGLADHADVTLEDGRLVLKNLGAITSMSYRDGTLSLYRGSALADTVHVSGIADPWIGSGTSNGVLSFAYSAGTLTVHDGGAAANAMGFGTVTGLTLHA